MDNASVILAQRRLQESYLAELRALDMRVARTERRREELLEEIRQASKEKRAALLSELSEIDWYREYLQARIDEREAIYHG